jgi:hypothetical protein
LPGASILAPRCDNSGSVMNCGHAFFMRAVGTTKNIAARFHTVANYSAATVFAFGSKRVNGAFKTVKVTRYAIVNDFQRLVVLISTNFTLHNNFSSVMC